MGSRRATSMADPVDARNSGSWSGGGMPTLSARVEFDQRPRPSERYLSIPGRQWHASPEPGEGNTGRVGTPRGSQGDRGEREDLESWKAQALARIWAGFNEPGPSSPRPSGSDGDWTRQRYADHARGLRLLVEEIEQDTAVSAALRDDLAESLRAFAGTNTERLPSDSPSGEAGQQAFGRASASWLRIVASPMPVGRSL